MIAPARWYAPKGRLVALITVLHIIGSVALAEDVQCNWYNDGSTRLKWIPSYSAEYEEELVTETCNIKVNCKSDAVLVADLPDGELTLEYLIKGDHRSKLYVQTPEEELLVAQGNYVDPQEDWLKVSVEIPKNVEKLYLSGHIVSSSNKIYLRGIGIQGVSRSCKSEPIKRTTTSTTTTTTTTDTTSTTAAMSTSASSTMPTTTSATTNSTVTVITNTPLFVKSYPIDTMPTTTLTTNSTASSLTTLSFKRAEPITSAATTTPSAVPSVTHSTIPSTTIKTTSSPTMESRRTSTITTRSAKPRPTTATTFTTTKKISVAGRGHLGNGGQSSKENEVGTMAFLVFINIIFLVRVSSSIV